MAIYLHKHDFIDEPFPLDRMTPERHGDEYYERIKAKKPTAPPRIYPGELVYSPQHDANLPVIHVYWRGGGHASDGWQVWVPGYGATDRDFSRARAYKPTHQYEQVNAHCWKHINTLEPTVGLKWGR